MLSQLDASAGIAGTNMELAMPAQDAADNMNEAPEMADRAPPAD